MENIIKAKVLFQKGVDAMEDGVLIIAESFFTESICCDPSFSEAYLLRAMVKMALLPENCRDDKLISLISDDLQKVL